MNGGPSEESGTLYAGSRSADRSPRKRARGRLARFLIHPLTLAIVAITVGGAAGLGGYFASRSEKPPSGKQATSTVPKFSYVGAGRIHAPNLPPAGSHVAFDATFTGSNLDTQTWATCFWYAAAGAGCTHAGVYNETEWYLPSQDVVSKGALNLVATSDPISGVNSQGTPETFPCRSGMVTTAQSFNFTYGYVQVVFRVPKGRNTWPALWMLPANHAEALPEIDLMEIIGTQTNHPAVAFHPAVGIQQRLGLNTSPLSAGWHTFGLDWEPGEIVWYVDGTPRFTVTKGVPSQPMYFLANLAITNASAPLRLPASCTGTLSIRSVEVWQKAPR
jgi:beta-glucanase (GH16 family)